MMCIMRSVAEWRCGGKGKGLVGKSGSPYIVPMRYYDGTSKPPLFLRYDNHPLNHPLSCWKVEDVPLYAPAPEFRPAELPDKAKELPTGPKMPERRPDPIPAGMDGGTEVWPDQGCIPGWQARSLFIPPRYSE